MNVGKFCFLLPINLYKIIIWNVLKSLRHKIESLIPFEGCEHQKFQSMHMLVVTIMATRKIHNNKTNNHL
jgi:hypothetical protein